jgi:hypothetical protein
MCGLAVGAPEDGKQNRSRQLFAAKQLVNEKTWIQQKNTFVPDGKTADATTKENCPSRSGSARGKTGENRWTKGWQQATGAQDNVCDRGQRLTNEDCRIPLVN